MEKAMRKPNGFKSIHLHIPPEFHKKLKVAVALKETTIRDYIMGLVDEDLNKMKTSKRDAFKEA
jgi:hypothetical protein